MFVPFKKFTKDIYDNLPDDKKETYNSEAQHRIKYLENSQFGHWLGANRNVEQKYKCIPPS
jgi:hypothetical protein